MREKKALDKLQTLLSAYSFTSKEAHQLGVSSATLAYYVKNGELVRIGHGIYRGVNAPVTADFRYEDLIEAVLRTKNGVICLITALILYELTDEMPSQHWIAISHDTIHRYTPPTRIVRMRNVTLGKTTIKIDNIILPIFDRERTIVDAFRYLGRETALKALRDALHLKGPKKISIAKLMQYAKQLRVNIDPYILAMTL